MGVSICRLACKQPDPGLETVWQLTDLPWHPLCREVDLVLPAQIGFAAVRGMRTVRNLARTSSLCTKTSGL